MNFTDNNYNGEKQIRDALKAKQKFTEDTSSETFRKKCEQRLFTQKSLPWTEIKKRAATNTKWQWHHPRALDDLKDEMIRKSYWCEEGTYVDKEPPKPVTTVRYRAVHRDEQGVVTLKLTPDYGDVVYFDYGASVTKASSRVTDFNSFKTDQLVVSFLCENSKGEHETGEPVTWTNKITIQSRVFDSGSDKMLELKASPNAPIRYTTDGSNPKTNGVPYEAPFPIPPKTLCVLAVAEKDGIISEDHRKDIKWDKKEELQLDLTKPVLWKRQQNLSNTKATYEFLDRLKKHNAKVLAYQVVVEGDHWLELTFDEKIPLSSEQLAVMIEQLRAFVSDGEVTLKAKKVDFPSGQSLQDWIAETKDQLKASEIEQSEK